MKKFLIFCFCLFSLFSENIHLERTFDKERQIFQEKFLNDQMVRVTYENQQIIQVDIGGFGTILYKYDENNHLRYIHRLSHEGELLYTHTYEHLGEDTLLEELIGDLGSACYHFSSDLETLQVESPFSFDEYHINDRDEASLSATLPLVYDNNGNICQKRVAGILFDLTFDKDNRLIKAKSEEKEIDFIYDDLGRKISKTTIQNGKKTIEYSLYLGRHEIAIYNEHSELKALRVLGPSYNKYVPKAVAFEADDQIYAAIHDCSLNIKNLINIHTKEIIPFTISPFGENIKKQNLLFPWIYASKHYDKDLDLIDFGYRYYDPDIHSWLSKDPLGPLQSDNLYQYCFNNPKKYIDIDGRIAFITIAYGVGGFTVSLPLLTTAGVAYLAYEYGPMVYDLCKKYIEQNPNKGFTMQEIQSGQYLKKMMDADVPNFGGSIPIYKFYS